MRLVSASVLVLLSVGPLAARVTPAQAPRPTFRAGVDRVTVTAVVHNSRTSQSVTGLTRGDFDVLDNGQIRPILEFRSEPAPANVALLIDHSGSMSVALKLPAARTAAADPLRFRERRNATP